MQGKIGTGPSVFGTEVRLLILGVQGGENGVEGTETGLLFVSGSAIPENALGASQRR